MTTDSMGSPDPETEFENWVQRIPMRALKCRMQGHRLPDYDDRRHVRMYAAGGVVNIEAECLRNCGTTVTTFLDESGYLTRARKVHYYDPQRHYLMPQEARGPGYTRERRAKVRKEFLERSAEWITQEG